MAVRFRPVDATFFDLFTESAQHLEVGVGLLAEMLADTSDRADVAQRMRAAEHDADETSHAVVRRAASTFVTPFDREDICALAARLDDVMDHMDEAVDLILLYDLKTLPPELSGQVEVLQRCADLTVEAMPRLRSPEVLAEYWIEVNRLQNASGRTYRRTMARLLSGEHKTREALKLRDVVGALEAAVGAFEKVADTVEQIAVKGA